MTINPKLITSEYSSQASKVEKLGEKGAFNFNCQNKYLGNAVLGSVQNKWFSGIEKHMYHASQSVSRLVPVL